jgi:hypothetical protein
MLNLTHAWRRNLALGAFTLGLSSSLLAVEITKTPDLGTFWNPLSPAGGTYVYANSFVAPVTGAVTSLGLWMNTMVEDATTAVTLQVWGGTIVDGPDYAQVLASTAGVSGMSGPLALYTASTISSSVLTAGQTYWFAATAVGASGSGRYQVGGHTPNSIYVDNGTFWYSNNPSGQTFDGQRLVPEMAFKVVMGEGNAVPDGGATALLLALPALALVGNAARRRRA